MRIEYLQINITISANDRKRVVAPTFKRIWDATQSRLDIESIDRFRDNLHAILCNAHENYVRLFLAKALDRSSQRGVLPSTSVDYAVYGDNTQVSVSGTCSSHYINIGPDMMNAVRLLTADKFYEHCIGSWTQEISRCLRLHPELFFKLLRGIADDTDND